MPRLPMPLCDAIQIENAVGPLPVFDIVSKYPERRRRRVLRHADRKKPRPEERSHKTEQNGSDEIQHALETTHKTPNPERN